MLAERLTQPNALGSRVSLCHRDRPGRGRPAAWTIDREVRSAWTQGCRDPKQRGRADAPRSSTLAGCPSSELTSTSSSIAFGRSGGAQWSPFAYVFSITRALTSSTVAAVLSHGQAGCGPGDGSRNRQLGWMRAHPATGRPTVVGVDGLDPPLALIAIQLLLERAGERVQAGSVGFRLFGGHR